MLLAPLLLVSLLLAGGLVFASGANRVSETTGSVTKLMSAALTPASVLVGHVTWQSRPAEPDARQQVPITLTLKLGATEVNYPSQTTDASGFFTISVDGLANGMYDWRVKGYFIPAEAGVRPGNFITIPSQAVDVNGNISIPYGGAIRARGRTQVELQQAIVDALKDRAIEPQAIVAVIDQRTSLITVLGDVARSGRIPAQLTPERILDTISRAGGIAGPGPDEWVMLERDGRRALSPFGALIYEPANNVYVHPNDIIYVYREPQTFLAFGAVGNQQQIPFGAWRISLAEAVAKAGGLRDDQADPASVFIYRGETRDVAEAMGVDCSNFQGPIIPVIYNINFRNPGSYFLATTWEMRNKDVIYVSNSVSVEATKFLTYVRTVNSTINDPINYAINAYTLRNLLHGTGNVSTLVGGTTPIVTAPSP